MYGKKEGKKREKKISDSQLVEDREISLNARGYKNYTMEDVAWTE